MTVYEQLIEEFKAEQQRRRKWEEECVAFGGHLVERFAQLLECPPQQITVHPPGTKGGPNDGTTHTVANAAVLGRDAFFRFTLRLTLADRGIVQWEVAVKKVHHEFHLRVGGVDAEFRVAADTLARLDGVFRTTVEALRDTFQNGLHRFVTVGPTAADAAIGYRFPAE